MRNDLRTKLGVIEIADHLGLAYDVFAPIAEGPKARPPERDPPGKIPADDKGPWLDRLCQQPVPADYSAAYERWKASFGAAERREVTLGARLLIGHGNPSGSEVGLSLHHTWGVPLIPGSALKGLLAHYLETIYGPAADECAQDRAERAPYGGLVWNEAGTAPTGGPGAVYRALFGAPPILRPKRPGVTDRATDRAIDRDSAAGVGAGAPGPENAGDDAAGEDPAARGAQGLVVFHDALYVPGSACVGNGQKDPQNDKPLAIDVLTVHQKAYYGSYGSAVKHSPNDYDSPVPVPFLTVRPGARFLLALSGPPDWVALAFGLLGKALADWGVGGKTSLGYGRGR